MNMKDKCHNFCASSQSMSASIMASATWARLGGFHEFALFLGPLRRLLFFRRQGRFLLIFSFIFDGFRHGVRSQYLCGGSSGQRMMLRRCEETCPSGLMVERVSEEAARWSRQ